MMRILPFSEISLAEALHILTRGGVIAHATETCYGLACDVSNIDAVKKLFTIKQRAENQPVSALFSSIDQAKQYAIWNDRAEELANKHWPGPLTLILPLREDAPKLLHPIIVQTCESHVSTTLGLRFSPHPHAQSLISSFGSPLSTTSANIHGKPNLYSADDILAQFSNADHQPDLILDAGILPMNPPSTVIDLTQETPLQKRKGAI